MASSWKNSEKEQLLKSLKKHGSGNLQAIASEISTKSKSEVKRAIKFYEFQGRKSLKANDSSRARQAPIDKWITIMQQLTVGQEGSGSQDLAAVFKIFAMCEENTSNDGVDFRVLYLMLADMASGYAPREPNEKTKKFLLESISEVVHSCRRETTKEECQLVKELNVDQIREKHRLRKEPDDDDDDEETNLVEKILTEDLSLNPLQMDGHFFKKKNIVGDHKKAETTKYKILKAMNSKVLLEKQK